MDKLSIFILCIYISSLISADAANILGVFSFCAHSHFWLGFRLMEELVGRGHNVTFINCFPRETPIKNLRDISVAHTKNAIAGKLAELTHFGQSSYWAQMEWMKELGAIYTEEVLLSPKVQDLLQSNEEFDLVIMEHLVNDAMVVFHHRFKCPLVISAPGPTTVFNNHLVANSAPPSFVPNLLSDYDSEMTFWERLANAFFSAVGNIHVHHRVIPRQSAILKELFPTAPSLEEMLYNASLMLTSSHVSLSGPVPLQQNIKEIGGYHVPTVKPLPREIKDFMDNATEGVVIFSMGSNLKASHFDEEKRRAIFEALSIIKQKVLWKFEMNYPDAPDNIKILEWLPQNDVLAHPNTVAFISHGGLLGTMEALHHGVPILGLPVFWDQKKNIADASRRGFAVQLNYDDLNHGNFKRLLTEILTDPRFRQNAKKQSKILKDQPMKQIDEAMFWLEYVIRHKGAPHLRTAAMNLKWYQLYLLDIFAFITMVIVSSFVIICRIHNMVQSNVKHIDMKNKNE